MSGNDHSDPICAWVCGLHELALEWIDRPPFPSRNATRAYADLYFAFCLARLRRRELAEARLERARAALVGTSPGHDWLYHAFAYRIRQALDGKGVTGPFPTEQLEKLEHVERLERYVVDRLRKHSRILEPEQVINPYRHHGVRISEFEKQMAELADTNDSDEIVRRVEKLLAETPEGPRGNEQRARVLRGGLESSPRVGEEFARRMLEQSTPAYDALPKAETLGPLMEQAQLLEKMVFVAGHFRLAEFIQSGLVRFQKMLHSTPEHLAMAASFQLPGLLVKMPQWVPGVWVFQMLEYVGKSAFRSLQKLQMHDEIERTLRIMRDVVLSGRPLSGVDFGKEEFGPAALRALLVIAGFWYHFGRADEAEPIIRVAHRLLFANELAPRDQTQLACAYVSAVGEGPVEAAQRRLEEVFRELKGTKDTYTTSSHFSVSQLDVVESVVLAVVGDDLTGPCRGGAD
jgi:hypothetical protein